MQRCGRLSATVNEWTLSVPAAVAEWRTGHSSNVHSCATTDYDDNASTPHSSPTQFLRLYRFFNNVFTICPKWEFVDIVEYGRTMSSCMVCIRRQHIFWSDQHGANMADLDCAKGGSRESGARKSPLPSGIQKQSPGRLSGNEAFLLMFAYNFDVSYRIVKKE